MNRKKKTKQVKGKTKDEKKKQMVRNYGCRVVLLRQDLVALTGNHKQALLLSQLIYWSERTKDFMRYAVEELFCEEKNYGWIYKNAKELGDDALLMENENTVRRHMKKLIEKGWVEERRNPFHRWDRTYQYRVNLMKIYEDVRAIGFPFGGYKVKIGESLRAGKVVLDKEYIKKQEEAEAELRKIEEEKQQLEALKMGENTPVKKNKSRGRGTTKCSLDKLQNVGAIPENTEKRKKQDILLKSNISLDSSKEESISSTNVEDIPTSASRDIPYLPDRGFLPDQDLKNPYSSQKQIPPLDKSLNKTEGKEEKSVAKLKDIADKVVKDVNSKYKKPKTLTPNRLNGLINALYSEMKMPEGICHSLDVVSYRSIKKMLRELRRDFELSDGQIVKFVTDVFMNWKYYRSLPKFKDITSRSRIHSNKPSLFELYTLYKDLYFVWKDKTDNGKKEMSTSRIKRKRVSL